MLDGFSGRVHPGSARMGCTVSFICCEDDFLQMPAHQHEVEEKKKERQEEVRWFERIVCLRLCLDWSHV